ncbi:hypothetical protein K438DRAFT_1835381 [Mycena galopus ATCC 62051]|nr:hypothetical protein K438DRAFT_1835381 [Mycena galopus ATCC 62051]
MRYLYVTVLAGLGYHAWLTKSTTHGTVNVSFQGGDSDKHATNAISGLTARAGLCDFGWGSWSSCSYKIPQHQH